MVRLNEEQIMSIKEHMCSDEKKLASLIGLRRSPMMSVLYPLMRQKNAKSKTGSRL